MSQTHPQQPHETAGERRHAAEEAEKKAANGKAKPRDKAHDAQMALALLLTDWLHGDRHFQAQLTELALDLLGDLSGGPDVKEPNEAQLMAQEAAGRLEGMPTGIRAAQSQPAQQQDERRMAPPVPTKAN